MKKLFMTAFCAAALTWGGCSDDSGESVGPNQPDNASLLIGTWRITRFSETEYKDGKKIYSHTDHEDTFITATFRDDGTYFWAEYGKPCTPTRYTYDSEAHILRLTLNPESGYFECEGYDLDVTWLSSGRLTFRFEMSDNYDGVAERTVRELSFRRDK